MKLADLQERIWETFKEIPMHESKTTTDAIVRATVEGLGFHFDAHGNICDPRPAPPSYPQQGRPYSKYSRPRGRR